VTFGVKTHEQEWGNEAIRRAAVDVDDWERSVWSSSPAPLIYGASMGGLNAVNIAYEFGARGLPITAVAVNSAALNLRSFYHRARTAIRINYLLPRTVLLPGDAGWVAAVDESNGGHDAIVRGATGLDPAIPFRFYVGTLDTVLAPPATNSVAFDADLAAAGWQTEHGVVTCTTCRHLSPLTFQPADVNAFFDRALANAA
jgi:hypothetical protein